MSRHSDNITDLAIALSKAQAVLKPAAKDSVNPHFKNKYADLQSVWDAARPVLAANGLSVVQTFSGDSAESVTVDTTLLHASGQWIGGSLTLRPTKADPQGAGSAITYARRYSLASILGIVADEDDDGNAASEKPAKITDQQAAELSKYLVEGNETLRKALEYYKVTDIGALSLAQAQLIIGRIKGLK